MDKINSILTGVLEKIKPSDKELSEMGSFLKDFITNLGKNLKKHKITAEIFVGGSFAKKTVIKKKEYDVDVFVRFDKKYEDKELAKLTKKVLVGVKGISIIHGSRDYFKIRINDWFFIEVVPVRKVGSPKESENITDLSYSHVNYINKKVKSRKMLNEIMLAKAFCYAHKCYGAESYINGFSGYSLELLVYYYGSFLKYIKAVTKMGPEKIVIDIEKHYRNKKIALMDLNESKLISPIVLIDPTYKYRNALAALSRETFDKFKKDCEKFLKNPTREAFELREVDMSKVKSNAKLKRLDFILLETKTDKQEGNVAGSKLFKFYNHLFNELGKYFQVKNKGFNYNEKKSARYFFVVLAKKEILIDGPFETDQGNVRAFKKAHKNYFVKNRKLYSKQAVNFDLQHFFARWILKNRVKIKEMYITDMDILKN